MIGETAKSNFGVSARNGKNAELGIWESIPLREYFLFRALTPYLAHIEEKDNDTQGIYCLFIQETDFAILVLTPDDVTTSRESEKPAPRDNVVFELGLFIGEASAANAVFLFTSKGWMI